jgi:AbrB family looped-hinge helix DNA binding protein
MSWFPSRLPIATVIAAAGVYTTSQFRDAHQIQSGLAGLPTHRVRRYLTSIKTTVSSKGQIVLPAELRQQDRIEAGQEFEVERLDRGDYRLVRLTTRPNEGLVDWLLACPEKGFFSPIESESTDTL